jgi:ribosomal protein S18 acetylase RimI-like enzyme
VLLARPRPALGVRYDTWLSSTLGVGCWTVCPRTDGERALEDVGDADFVSARCAVDDLRNLDALTGQGLRVVDTALLLSVGPILTDSGLSSPSSCAEFSVGLAEEPDADTIAQMASHSLTQSRFHLDPRFPNDLASKIKYEWGKALALGERGDRCMVARQGKQVRGFLGVVSPDSSPRISIVDLIAVDPEVRSQGVGRLLVNALLRDAVSGGYRVQVGTQAANTRAVAFYEALGFRLHSAQYVLHSNWPLRSSE